MPNNYVASDTSDAEIHRQLPAARVEGRRSATNDAKKNRLYLCDYFNSQDGAVSWQDSML